MRHWLGLSQKKTFCRALLARCCTVQPIHSPSGHEQDPQKWAAVVPRVLTLLNGPDCQKEERWRDWDTGRQGVGCTVGEDCRATSWVATITIAKSRGRGCPRGE